MRRERSPSLLQCESRSRSKVVVRSDEGTSDGVVVELEDEAAREAEIDSPIIGSHWKASTTISIYDPRLRKSLELSNHVGQIRLQQGAQGSAVPFLSDFGAERCHAV